MTDTNTTYMIVPAEGKFSEAIAENLAFVVNKMSRNAVGTDVLYATPAIALEANREFMEAMNEIRGAQMPDKIGDIVEVTITVTKVGQTQ